MMAASANKQRRPRQQRRQQPWQQTSLAGGDAGIQIFEFLLLIMIIFRSLLWYTLYPDEIFEFLLLINLYFLPLPEFTALRVASIRHSRCVLGGRSRHDPAVVDLALT